MFKPHHFENRFVGYSLEKDGRFYFFGARGFTREDLPRAFPHYKFCFLKQIHSSEVKPADFSGEPEGDALYTSDPLVAVVAKSADCTPILLSSKSRVCAIHSGWRGTAQNIVHATKAYCEDVTFAAIGPHILRPSFEVGADVAATLDKASPRKISYATPERGGKCHYDLNMLVQAQLHATYGSHFELELCLFDTKTDTRFCSYRRDASSAGLQFSFVVINAEKPGSILK